MMWYWMWIEPMYTEKTKKEQFVKTNTGKKKTLNPKIFLSKAWISSWYLCLGVHKIELWPLLLLQTHAIKNTIITI